VNVRNSGPVPYKHAQRGHRNKNATEAYDIQRRAKYCSLVMSKVVTLSSLRRQLL